jgi:hypothetical protein
LRFSDLADGERARDQNPRRVGKMKIQAVEGEIIEVAPRVAEAMVLWLRSGYCARHSTWAHKIVPRYQARCATLPTSSNVDDAPWRSPEDQLFRLEPPDGHLRLLYVFANPEDAQGVASLDEVRALIERCLDGLARRGCRSMAIIHIPIALPGRTTTVKEDTRSAVAMIDALRSWDERHPGEIDDVFCVDLADGFKEQLGQ